MRFVAAIVGFVALASVQASQETDGKESQFHLGYWKSRGTTNQIRYLLEYSNVSYTELRLDYDLDGDKWEEMKVSDPEMLSYPFPNLPHLRETRSDGTIVRLTQSTAIMRYLAKRLGLAGNTVEEEAKIDMVYNTVADIRELYKAWNKDDELIMEMYPHFEEQSLDLFTGFSKLLGENQFIGVPDRVTYVDFYLYEILQTQKVLNDKVFEKYPNLQAFCNRIEALPRLKQYFKSESFITWPFFGPWAKKFGHFRK